MSFEAAGYQTIGIAQKSPHNTGDQENPVVFKVPHGDNEYSILLNNQEMDALLTQGFEQEIGHRALIGSGYIIELYSPDLPLFTKVAAIDVSSKRPSHCEMDVSVFTMSSVYDHRGILSVHRDGLGTWELDSYTEQPPLQVDEGVAA